MKVCEGMMKFTIIENGDVIPCPWMKRDIVIGNLFTQEVDEIVNGEKYKKLVKSVSEGGF